MRPYFSTAAIVLAMLLFPATPQARAAESSCVKAYEAAIHPYWLIASDMLRFKTMFDNYDRLCSTHHADAIAALQPDADLLRAQVAADVKKVETVLARVFEDHLPAAVAPSCRDDSSARKRVKNNIAAAIRTQNKTVSARLEKSALGLRGGTDLVLCTQLAPHRKTVRKALGPDFENPLFEMTVINSTLATRDLAYRGKAIATWRGILADLKSAPAE